MVHKNTLHGKFLISFLVTQDTQPLLIVMVSNIPVNNVIFLQNLHLMRQKALTDVSYREQVLANLLYHDVMCQNNYIPDQ